MAYDIIALEGEDSHGGEPLLVPVMRNGKRITGSIMLDELRRRTLAGYTRLPGPLTTLNAVTPVYPVEISPALRALAKKLDAESGANPFAARAS